MDLSCPKDMSRLHKIGEIQSCGYLLAVVEEEADGFLSGLRIVAASQNVDTAQWIHVSSADELEGKDLGYVFHGKCLETVRSLVAHQKKSCEPRSERVSCKANRNKADIHPALPTLDAAENYPPGVNEHGVEGWTCTVAGSNPGVYLIEVEPKISPRAARREPTSDVPLETTTTTVADLLGYIPVGANPQDTTAALATAFMEAMPAFDRVLVYRFAPDATGEVIAESIRPEYQGNNASYLNLRFPAADIPPRAREALKLNGVRIIVDTSAGGVPVRVFDDEKIAALDLTMSVLRAPLACHQNYLRNMGVKASMVVAIVVDGDLWGLYACHSYTTVVHPLYEERFAMEMAATVTASMISKHRLGEVALTSLSLSRMLGKISHFTKVKHFLAAEHRALLSILEVDTIILSENLRSVIVYGNKELSLTLEDCKDLTRRTDDGSNGGTVLLRSLETKGVAFFSVRSFLVAFVRGSIKRHVKWAGIPDPPMLKGKEEGQWHPRKSFDMYMEQTAAEFKAWSPTTLDLLEMASQSLSSHVYAEALPVDLQEIFEQMSHELRTPFHGVMASLDMLQDGQGTMDAGERSRILEAAILCGGSMMSILNNILDIAKDSNNVEEAHDRFLASSPIRLAVAAMTPFANSERLKLVADLGSPADEEGGGALEVIGDERRINAILQNLVTNAIKFTPRGGEVRASLVVFDSLEDTLGWWTKESSRFDGKILMGSIADNDNDNDNDIGNDIDNDNGNGNGNGDHPNATGGEQSSPLPPLAAEKKWYVFCVEDSGAGVLPGNLPYLVAPYRQMLHGAHPGTGLGLHICMEYLDVMGGALGIASTPSAAGKPGGGSMFAVLLPFCLAEAKGEVKGESPSSPVVVPPEMVKPSSSRVVVANEAGSTAAAAASAIGLVGNRNLVFIVVEDHQTNIKLLQHKIGMCFKRNSTCRVEVLAASDGLQALDKLTELRITQQSSGGGGAVLAGMFVDMHMPNLDGIECTRRARLLEEENGWPRTAIYGCTANLTDKVHEAFHGAGVDGVLPKPWERGQVETVCAAMIQQLIEVEKNKATGAGAGKMAVA